MSDTFPLKDARHDSFPDEPISSWQFGTDHETVGNYRVYYKPVEHSAYCNGTDCVHGFYFYSLAWAGNWGDAPTWSDETFIDTLYYGVALFDGLRHVNFGSDKDGIFGYTNYPNPKVHIGIWQILEMLEERYCDSVNR